MENWKTIPGYEGLYEVSDHGNIKSIDRINTYIKEGISISRPIKSIQLKPSLSSNGYMSLVLNNGAPKSFMVHRLVAQCFCQNAHNKEYVNHIDGNKLNNAAINLEWCTRQENIDHAFSLGLMHKHKGSTHHKAKLKDLDVFNIQFLSRELKIPYHIIGEFYNVKPHSIRNICFGKSWKHLIKI